MNRNSFLRKLGLGLIGVAVAPKIIDALPAKEIDTSKYIAGCDPYKENDTGMIFVRDLNKYPLTYAECYRPEEILKVYKHQGICVNDIITPNGVDQYVVRWYDDEFLYSYKLKP